MVEEPRLEIPRLGSFMYEDLVDIIDTRNPAIYSDIARPETLRFFEQIGKEGEPKPHWLAWRIFEDFFPSHNCYWNDKFYIANRFNLRPFHKKQAAVVVLWNGRKGYFEWITHFGFDNAKLFHDLGLIIAQQEQDFRKFGPSPEGYRNLSEDLMSKLQRMFGVGTRERDCAHLINETVWHKEGR